MKTTNKTTNKITIELIDSQLVNIPFLKENNIAIDKQGNVYDENNNIISSRIINGYCNVIIFGKYYAIHRLVAFTYISNDNNYNIVDHINEDKLDNRVENLRWVTQKMNINFCTKSTCHPRSVLQIDIDGTIIQRHSSMIEAGANLGTSRGNISKACRGINLMAVGFYWKYENEDLYTPKEVDLSETKPIEDFPNYYVFPDSRIYNIERKMFLTHIKNANGHTYISLSKKEGKKNRYINRIVYELFGSEPINGNCIYHINKVKDDNRIENLTINLSDVDKERNEIINIHKNFLENIRKLNIDNEEDVNLLNELSIIYNNKMKLNN